MAVQVMKLPEPNMWRIRVISRDFGNTWYAWDSDTPGGLVPIPEEAVHRVEKLEETANHWLGQLDFEASEGQAAQAMEKGTWN